MVDFISSAVGVFLVNDFTDVNNHKPGRGWLGGGGYLKGLIQVGGGRRREEAGKGGGQGTGTLVSFSRVRLQGFFKGKNRPGWEEPRGTWGEAVPVSGVDQRRFPGGQPLLRAAGKS